MKCAIRLWAGSLSSYQLCQPIPAQLHLHFLLGFFSPHPLLASVVSYLRLFYFGCKGVAINRQTSSVESTSVGLNCVLQPLFALGSFQPVEIPFIFPHSIWLMMSRALQCVPCVSQVERCCGLSVQTGVLRICLPLACNFLHLLVHCTLLV